MQNQKYTRLYHFIVIAVMPVVVVAAALGFVLVQHKTTDASPSTKLTSATAAASLFSFAGTPNWSRGPSNRTSMAIFHSPHDCFVSEEYHRGTIDTAATLQQYQAGLTSGGYVIAPSDVQTATLQTNSAPLQYQLHQFMVSGSGSMGAPEGGQELGYLQLTNGYIKVEGYCDTTSELPATITALQAMKFSEPK